MVHAMNPALPFARFFGESFAMVPENRWTGPTVGGSARDSSPFQHAANITTMAIWLSVAACSAVAAFFPGRKFQLQQVQADKPGTLEVTLDSVADSSSLFPSSEPSGSAPPPLRPLPLLRPLVRPPAMPASPALNPLPVIPQLPRTARAGSQQHTPASVRPVSNPGSGLPSAALRFAAGTTPDAPYPPYSKRNRQEGTVIVEFAVDGTGRVTAVFVKQPCRWPLLNSTAVRTVYSWSFPPGPFMTLEVPIVFKIQ